MTPAERIAALRAQVADRRVRAVGVHNDTGYANGLRHCAAETLTRVRLEVAVLDHVEGVLGRHRPNPAQWCRGGCVRSWPCPDAAAALALLDQLDGGTDD